MTDSNTDTVFYRRGFETSAGVRAQSYEQTSRFIAIVSMPIALVMVVRLLLGLPVVDFVFYAFPIILAITSFLMQYWFRTTTVGVRFRGDAAWVENAWSGMRAKPTAFSWNRVIDVRRSPNELSTTVGLDPYTFQREDWPQFDELARAFERCTTHYTDRSGSDST